ncbi:Veg family protein [Clostridium cylindrosporum]|uniref:Veg protein n=1 Tax=Clostridium cylindrosporum DSM 605 TaxID=1121307 RepID=A0A0J8D9U2_CLOCY|nr:Veg family protein [Clostridium cylindrosporum]KMT22825.1 hypothetical protein CLCY_5c00640 [Clostridium cylindrosporum DSM 605]
MKGKDMLDAIKENISRHVGQRIVLKANSGRKKVVIREGILEQTYPNIFIVRLGQEGKTERRVSYSYSDILTRVVQIECNNVVI